MEGREVVFIVMAVFGTLGTVLYPLAKALATRIEGRTTSAAAMPGDIGERLDRIEHAVEAVALEVERISEGQRFVTKLMAERQSPRLPGARDSGTPL